MVLQDETMAGCDCLDRHGGDIGDDGLIFSRSRCKNLFKIRFCSFENGFFRIAFVDRRFFCQILAEEVVREENAFRSQLGDHIVRPVEARRVDELERIVA